MNTPIPIALTVDITRAHAGWTRAHEALAQESLSHALAFSGHGLEGPCELSLLLTDDAAQRELNARWRGADKTTNVLSFPQIGPDDPLEGLLGDMAFAYETLVREAQALEKPFAHHFVHLLVHGLLHILGEDHQTRSQALAMEARETDILARMGYPDPYDGQEPQD